MQFFSFDSFALKKIQTETELFFLFFFYLSPSPLAPDNVCIMLYKSGAKARALTHHYGDNPNKQP